MGQPFPTELQEAIGEVAAGFDQATLGREIALVAVKSIPQLAAQVDTELLEETVLAATSNVAAIVGGLIDGIEPDQIPVPANSRRWVEWLVARNVDTAAIPWAYSFGNGRMADALREVVGRLDLPGEERWTLGEGLTRYVQRYVEHVSADLIDHHVREHERWHSGTAAHHRQLVRRLLAGEPVDVIAASRELGYDLRGTHLAVVLWGAAEADPPPSEAAREAAAQRLLHDAGARQVLCLSHPDGTTWAWGQGEALGDRHEEGRLEAEGMLAALGTVTSGSRGFPHTHHDAQHARRVAGLLGRRSGSLVPYRSVALTALIAHDPDQALRFVEAELGPLTEDSDAARRLRATVGAYLEEGLRPVRAARRLGVHQNTVAYRITQAEEAIGYSLSERRLELEMALRLAEALPSLRAGRGH